MGAADQDYLNSGDPNGKNWVVPLCNTSIRPGWFYHESENDLVKTPLELVDVYYKSVGRNGVLLLNVPPDKRGLFHENDIKSLRILACLGHQKKKKGSPLLKDNIFLRNGLT